MHGVTRVGAMRVYRLVLAASLALGLLAFAAPATDAREACVDLYTLSDPTCPGIVCAWDGALGEWECIARIYQPTLP